MSDVLHLPAASVTRRVRFSVLWVVPIVCAALGLYLGIHALVSRGPAITMTFKSAEGIVAGQTQIRHKAVVLGTVDEVALSEDLSHVVVHVRMGPGTESFLTDHARFWVVRPRLTSLSALESGLSTLVSGSYIEVDPGLAGGHRQRTFEGLEDPPGVRSDEPGHIYTLRTNHIGSLGPGAPVFYRDANVGEVLSYALGDGQGAIAVRVFVRAPYDGFVHDDTQFWNASGLSVSMGAQGLKVELESLEALAVGGVAFESPPASAGPPAAADRVFPLYDSEPEAKARFYKQRFGYVTYFQSSVQGLTPGSSVQLFGVQIGIVTDVRLVPDRRATGSPALVRVAFDLQPERVGAPPAAFSPEGLRPLVARGLRVLLDSTSLLTGQKVLALQYMPGAKGGALEQEGHDVVLPSQAAGLDDVMLALADVAEKAERIPFDDIGRDLDGALRSVQQTVGGPDMQSSLRSLAATLGDAKQLVHEANGDLTPAMQKLPAIADQLQQAVQALAAALGEGGYGKNSDFQRSMTRLLEQAGSAARTIRLLSDFLDRHPEALIRGRAGASGEH